MVYAALLTGCRYGELCRLRAADYDAKVCTLAIRESKSGKTRHVTLTEEAAELFNQLTVGREHSEAILMRTDGTVWNRAQQVRPMRELCGRAGIDPPAGFHVLRHTHASILAMRGVPMAVIARQLGHADTRMTERHYAHLAPNYIAETIRANFPILTTSAKQARERLLTAASLSLR
jgi:integrase